MRPILTLSLVLTVTPSVKNASADEMAMRKPAQSMAMTGMMEMMSPQPGFRLYGWIEAGITGNFAFPNDNQNFGRLLDDRSNEPLLNQFVLGAERGLDPNMADRFDWAFRIQFLYGSDTRYLKSIGLFDLVTDALIQPDTPEAWFLAHFPMSGTTGGLDVKLGEFMTCLGADMSDPRYNVFYSRDYIFNFGCPFYGTGALLTLHAVPELDLYAGIDRGVNVALEDNNDSVSFYGGAMMNCCKGKACCVAKLHAGPEDPRDNHDERYLSDIVTTWKITDKLTSITDINFAYEESVNAKGYGIAQFLTYAINDCCTVGIRGEVWRDADGFFVAQFASNNDFIHFERGDDSVFDPRTVGGGRTTYGAITAGLTIKPRVPAPLTGLMIRPEIRYDRSLNGTDPLNDSSDRDMFTAAVDVVVMF
ncbi:MAG: porin [Verrucomicrobia bacterium]|nr:MAG: porin [Verrucomicrobiota bacterium]